MSHRYFCCGCPWCNLASSSPADGLQLPLVIVVLAQLRAEHATAGELPHVPAGVKQGELMSVGQETYRQSQLNFPHTSVFTWPSPTYLEQLTHSCTSCLIYKASFHLHSRISKMLTWALVKIHFDLLWGGAAAPLSNKRRSPASSSMTAAGELGQKTCTGTQHTGSVQSHRSQSSNTHIQKTGNSHVAYLL